MDNDNFDFDIGEPQEREFTYRGREHIVKEATAEAARVYNNARTKAARYDIDSQTKQIRVKGMALDGVGDVEMLLVSQCLFVKDTKQPVPIAELRKWQSKVVTRLFEWVKKVSELDGPEEPSKNGDGRLPSGATSEPPTDSAAPSAST